MLGRPPELPFGVDTPLPGAGQPVMSPAWCTGSRSAVASKLSPSPPAREHPHRQVGEARHGGAHVLHLRTEAVRRGAAPQRHSLHEVHAPLAAPGPCGARPAAKIRQPLGPVGAFRRACRAPVPGEHRRRHHNSNGPDHGGFSVEEECPRLAAWARRCLERESMAKCLTAPEEVHDFIGVLKNRKYGVE